MTIEHKLNLRTILLVLILIFNFITISSAIQLDINHKSVFCFDCHGGNSGYSVGQDEYCGDCHSLYFENKNFPTQHESLTCKGCHGIISKETFHPVHMNTSCITCHIDNTLPEANYSVCLDCHVSGLHSTHLEKKCEMCHPNTIPQKMTPTPISKYTQVCDEEGCWNEPIYETNNTNETKSINTLKPITNYRRLTIYEILVNIIKAIRDDIYGKNNINNPAVVVDSSRNMGE